MDVHGANPVTKFEKFSVHRLIMPNKLRHGLVDGLGMDFLI
jgi:hypothetical protein